MPAVRTILKCARVLACLTLLPTFASAAPIFVGNAGFEEIFTDNTLATPTSLGDGNYTRGVQSTGEDLVDVGILVKNVFIPNWVSAGDETDYNFGILNPDIRAYTNGAHGGTYVAYGLSSTMTQTLSATLAAGTYTLSVYVGNRKDQDAGAPDLALLAGAASLTPTTSSAPTVADDTWQLWTKTFVIAADDALIGQTLKIQLSASDDQPTFDDVSLDFAAVPEPASVSILGLAVAGLIRRRR